MWGETGTAGIPIIVDDGFSSVLHNWFDIFGDYPDNVFIDHEMRIVNITQSEMNQTAVNNIIQDMLDNIPEISGCTDPEACNYDEGADSDNNSCVYEVDCAGECGGVLELDCCGTCGGDNSTCDNCCGAPFNDDCSSDCYENPVTGECCYNSEVDECGTCYGDGTSCIDVLGCTYSEAINYDLNATIDDGSCEFMLGDYNQDDTLNVLDIVQIVNAILDVF